MQQHNSKSNRWNEKQNKNYLRNGFFSNETNKIRNIRIFFVVSRIALFDGWSFLFYNDLRGTDIYGKHNKFCHFATSSSVLIWIEMKQLICFKFLFLKHKKNIHTRYKSSRNERPHQRRAKHELNRPIHVAQWVCVHRVNRQRQRGGGDGWTSGNGNVGDVWSLRWKLNFCVIALDARIPIPIQYSGSGRASERANERESGSACFPVVHAQRFCFCFSCRRSR